MPDPTSTTPVAGSAGDISEIIKNAHFDVKWNEYVRRDSTLLAPSHPIWEELYDRAERAIQQAASRIEAAVAQHPQRVGRLSGVDYINAAIVYLEPRRGGAATKYKYESFVDPQQRDLLRCDPGSIVDAVCKLAGSQLAVSRDNETAFLVPVVLNKEKNPRLSVQATPGIKGYEMNLGRSGMLQSSQTFIVYEQDDFRYVEGGDRDPEITRPRRGYDKEAPNRITHALARIVLKDGRKHIECIMHDEESVKKIGTRNSRLTVEQNLCKQVALRAHRQVLRTFLHDVTPQEMLELANAQLPDGVEPTQSGEAASAAQQERPAPAAQTLHISGMQPAPEPRPSPSPAAGVPTGDHPSETSTTKPQAGPSQQAMEAARQRLAGVQSRATEETATRPAPTPEVSEPKPASAQVATPTPVHAAPAPTAGATPPPLRSRRF